MNAEQFLAVAESIRSYALASGRDLNASNLFVHDMLMRAIEAGARVHEPALESEDREAA